MADERTYGFSIDDAQSIIQSISNGESTFQEIRPRGGGGGGGTGGCSSCCTSVRTGNMLHPDLPTGSDETTRDWSFASACGDAIGAIEIPNDDGSLVLVWAGGTPTATYEDTDDTFTVEITSECTMLDSDGEDVTSETDFEAFFTMDFATLEITISWEEL